MKTQKELLFERMKVVNPDFIIKEDIDRNLSDKAVLLSANIKDNIISMIEQSIDDNLYSEISRNSDTFFDFYEKVLDSVMSGVYEKYADSFDSNAGAAPDERY